MAGFGPVGSIPVGALPSSSGPITNYTPGTATITFEGFPPITIFNYSPARVYGLYAEVMNTGDPAKAQVYGLYAEVLVSLDIAGGNAGSVSIIW